MPSPETPEAAALLHSRTTLWLFEQLLRDGIVPFTPVSPGDVLDASIRCADGTYRDLIVCPSFDEHFPLAFRASGLEPRPRLHIVCIAWAVEPVQVWIFPSQDFSRYGVVGDGFVTLDLEALAPER